MQQGKLTNAEIVVTAELDAVGLGYSGTMGHAVIVEGGISDPVKAMRVSAFGTAIADADGMVSGAMTQENQQRLLAGRRALFDRVVVALRERGAEIKSREAHRGLTVDETCRLLIEGEAVTMVLLPR